MLLHHSNNAIITAPSQLLFLAMALKLLMSSASVEAESVKLRLLQAGNVAESEMFRTFNMGVGMLLILDKESVSAALKHDPEAFVMGEVVAGRGVNLV